MYVFVRPFLCLTRIAFFSVTAAACSGERRTDGNGLARVKRVGDVVEDEIHASLELLRVMKQESGSVDEPEVDSRALVGSREVRNGVGQRSRRASGRVAGEFCETGEARERGSRG